MCEVSITMAVRQSTRNKGSNKCRDFVYSDDDVVSFEGDATATTADGRGRSRGKEGANSRGEFRDNNIIAAAATGPSDAEGVGEGDSSSMGDLPSVITESLSSQDVSQILGALSDDVRQLILLSNSTKEAFKILFGVLNDDQVKEVVRRNSETNDCLIRECLAQAVSGALVREVAWEEGRDGSGQGVGGNAFREWLEASNWCRQQ